MDAEVSSVTQQINQAEQEITQIKQQVDSKKQSLNSSSKPSLTALTATSPFLMSKNKR
ncbi:hypothetical protein MUB16_31540 [Priestia sp. OVL9]|nr:hypothetical protein [Priestia sp. OVL9]